MPSHTIYTYISRPAGILRVLLSIVIVIMVASAWNAIDMGSWFTGMLPYILWVIPATLNWLALMLLTGFVLRLSPKLMPTFAAKPFLRLLCYRLWPIILGGVCAGFFAGMGLIYHTTPEHPKFFISYWNWPAALWGALIAAGITEWFHLYAKGQDPADNQAKLMELQARIRPHFLFNTLNSAMALVRLDPDAAESVLQNLATLFRTALESGDSNVATVQEEVNLAKSYLSIESIRLEERLKIEWQIADDTLPIAIPKLSLQPLLENAIRHGIEPSNQTGRILVTSSQRLGKIILTVSNTMPSPTEQLENTTKGHGMALANLRARIALLHDFEGALQTKIWQNDDKQYWFKVTLKVPISK